jgi:DNA-binding transcriptional ArsR family regulator
MTRADRYGRSGSDRVRLTGLALLTLTTSGASLTKLSGSAHLLVTGTTMTRQAVTKHLAALRSAGLVEASRTGRETRYALTPAPLASAVEWIEEVGAAWDERLGALKRLVDGGGSAGA